jgi:hypothetical protein
MTIGPFGFALALCACLPAILSRLLRLAPTRLGFLVYFSNVVNELTVKRLHLHRSALEIALLAVGATALAVTEPLAWVGGAGVVAIVFVLQMLVVAEERLLLTTNYAWPDRRAMKHRGAGGPVGSVPEPSRHPKLVINLRGPFARRRPGYDLGDLVVGRTCRLTVLIGNHSTVPCQVPCAVSVVGSRAVRAALAGDGQVGPLVPGDVAEVPIECSAVEVGRGGRIGIAVSMAGRKQLIPVRFRSVRATAGVESATITRYPGACRAAFAWRGDMDHYDTVSFQSIQGLEVALGLAARYRMPQTMFLSTRLTLDPVATSEYYEHFGVRRGQKHVEGFVAWIGENVDLRHEMAYPFVRTKRFAVEIGNHMHLHYGTHAAAAPENNWRPDAGIGAGRYPWQGEGSDSFSEQRDNALEARRWIEERLGFTPRSWSTPDSTRDEATPAAVEAAGCLVLSDSDSRHLDNVILQPAPHHPAGSSAVELTKRYPGDPMSIFHVAMIRYWMHRAHRTGIPVVFMCHQHMRQFAGHACTRFTESILRYVLTRFNGDLHVNTVYGIGRYWNEVFSPKNGSVSVSVKDGAALVEYRGKEALESVPVDLRLTGGGRSTVLLDLAQGSRYRVHPNGSIEQA